jgi:alpha-terpineol hydroxylase
VTVRALDQPVAPDDIARDAVLAESYKTETKPYVAFRWLRENMPIARAYIDGFDPLWLVSKHADILAIERDPHLFHTCYQEHDNPILQDRANDEFQRSLHDGSIRMLDEVTFMGPEEHSKVRGAANPWFMPKSVRAYESAIRELAVATVDRMAAMDGECDFVTDVASHFPLQVIMTMLGVPPEDEPRMLALTQEFFGSQDPDTQREDVKADPVAAAKMWHATIRDFESYFQDLADDRRREPRSDLISLIANSTLDGEPLSISKQTGWFVATATAGHDTTSSTLSGGMHALIEHPDQFAAAKADPGAVAGLVDESLRWTSPVRHFVRTATEDTVVRGQEIAAGDRLMILYPSANRDEEVFENPDRFDISRKPNRHIAFGFGPHMCIGQHVTKLELRILWAELLPRLKSVELVGEPKYAQANFVGGLRNLPLRFEMA